MDMPPDRSLYLPMLTNVCPMNGNAAVTTLSGQVALVVFHSGGQKVLFPVTLSGYLPPPAMVVFVWYPCNISTYALIDSVSVTALCANHL